MIALAALHPFLTIGSGGTTSLLLGWVLTLVIIAAVVWFVVWLVTKFAGPPNIPEPLRWVIWVIVAILLLAFIFVSLGISV